MLLLLRCSTGSTGHSKAAKERTPAGASGSYHTTGTKHKARDTRHATLLCGHTFELLGNDDDLEVRLGPRWGVVHAALIDNFQVGWLQFGAQFLLDQGLKRHPVSYVRVERRPAVVKVCVPLLFPGSESGGFRWRRYVFLRRGQGTAAVLPCVDQSKLCILAAPVKIRMIAPQRRSVHLLASHIAASRHRGCKRAKKGSKRGCWRPPTGGRDFRSRSDLIQNDSEGATCEKQFGSKNWQN